MISYITHAGNDNLIANVARISMAEDSDWLELPHKYSEVERDGLLNYLAVHKHTSPFRHNSITIKGEVPMFIARQLGKHQVGMSWNEKSMRYRESPEFLQDIVWRKQTANTKQGSGDPLPEEQQAIMNDVYKNVLDTTVGAYEFMLQEEVCREQARMNLPQSMMVEFVWTGSLMAFAHVYALRIDEHAQKEAQEFAKALDDVIRPLFPVSWDKLTRKEVCSKQESKQRKKPTPTIMTKLSSLAKFKKTSSGVVEKSK